MVINPEFRGAQVRDYLEDTSNLDSCARQTNIRTKLPEKEYTKKTLEARGSIAPKPGTFVPGIAAETRQLPRFRGNGVESRVDFRRVAPSRLPKGAYAYINPCRGPEREHFSFF